MSLDTLVNRGISFINNPTTHTETKTVIVVGAARGGTSIVAGALYHLGVYLGRNCHPPVYEDMRLSLSFEKNGKDTFEQVIEDYNRQHTIWGWKRPSTLHDLPRVMSAVRNPYLVIVFRDLFSIANRNKLSMKLGIKDGLQRALDDYTKIIGYIQQCTLPMMLVSSEKIIHHKEHLIEGLCDFLALQPETAKRRKALDFISPDPPDYINATRITRAKGAINMDMLRTGTIWGWARASYHTNPVYVEILVDQKIIATICANIYREDVKRLGIHPTGMCGYRLDLKNFNVRPQSIITVRVKDDVVPLNKEPISFQEFDEWMSMDEWLKEKQQLNKDTHHK